MLDVRRLLFQQFHTIKYSLQRPNFDGHVLPSSRQNCVARVVADRRHEMFMSLHTSFLLPEVEIPNSHCLVVRSRVQPLACGMHGQRADPSVVPHESVQSLSVRAVPEPDALVATRRYQEEALRRLRLDSVLGLLQAFERGSLELRSQELRGGEELCPVSLDEQDALYYVVVPRKRHYRCFFVDRPKHHRLVRRATREGLRIWCGDHLTYPVFMAYERALAESSGDFPEFDGLVARAADDALVVEHEGGPGDGVVVPVEGLGALVLAELPELDREVAGARDEELAVVAEVGAGHRP